MIPDGQHRVDRPGANHRSPSPSGYCDIGTIGMFVTIPAVRRVSREIPRRVCRQEPQLPRSHAEEGCRGGTCELFFLKGSSINSAEASRYFRVFSLWFVGYFVASEWETN